MTFDRQFLYLRAIGHFGTLATFPDRWSTGWKLASVTSTVPTLAGLSGFLDAVQGPISIFHSNALTRSGSNVFLDQLTVAKIGEDGKYDPPTQDTTIRDYVGSVPGNGTPTQPFSSSFVGSLRTSRPRGYASNGRFYWPMLAANLLTTTGRMAQADIQSWLTNAQTMLNAINTAGLALGTPVRLHVMSQHGAGLSAAVTAVRADGRMDSIERRENDQPSVYESKTVS